MSMVLGNLNPDMEERLLRNYYKAIHIVREVLGDEVYEEYKNGPDFLEVKTYSKNAYATCSRHLDLYYNNITINPILFQATDEDIINTLIHEILHTFRDTYGHDKMWKYYAKTITNKTNYKISRLDYIDGIDYGYKYKVFCCDCGYNFGLYRMSKKRKYAIDNGMCSCYKCKGYNIKIEVL